MLLSAKAIFNHGLRWRDPANVRPIAFGRSRWMAQWSLWAYLIERRFTDGRCFQTSDLISISESEFALTSLRRLKEESDGRTMLETHAARHRFLGDLNNYIPLGMFVLISGFISTDVLRPLLRLLRNLRNKILKPKPLQAAYGLHSMSLSTRQKHGKSCDLVDQWHSNNPPKAMISYRRSIFKAGSEYLSNATKITVMDARSEFTYYLMM